MGDFILVLLEIIVLCYLTILFLNLVSTFLLVEASQFLFNMFQTE